MATASQKKATTEHRRRASARGLVRVEIQAAKADTSLIRTIADVLRADGRQAKRLRAALENALIDPEVKDAFDIFGSDLPDEAFDAVFDQARQITWREIDV